MLGHRVPLQNRIKIFIKQYPRPFWVLVIVTFIDRLGGALLFPFFALYLTNRFQIGMTEVGSLFAIFSLSSFFGVTIGGALTDRLGRRGMLIFSLIATSFSAVAMGLVDSMQTFTILALFVGILSDAGSPAYDAAVADMLPEGKRAEGYGLLRIVLNLSVTIGPAIGGFLARNSYLLLFLADATISLLAATILFLAFPETKPQPKEGQTVAAENLAQSFGGYGRVLRDRTFILFSLASLLSAFVYINMNTTLGVYLRDHHNIPESGYGLILSLNAAMVVLFQFSLTRRTEKFPPMLILALSSLLYAVGFGLYGIVSAYWLFLGAMVVITIGEMLYAPNSRAVVARLAPEDMRGRYNAVFSYSWGIAFAAGPILAGVVLDNYNPNWLWYIAFGLGVCAALGYAWLNRLTQPDRM
jgi:MFS family permease